MSPSRNAYQARPPTRADGARIWSFVDRNEGLDANSPYAYLLFAEEFAATSAVTDGPEGDLAGFVLGFAPPSRPDTLFVWQVAVAPAHRGRGLAGQLITSVLDRHELALRHLEATVTPDNEPSRRLFQGIAETLGVPCRVTPHLLAEDFPGDAPHDPEDLFRIGPIDEPDLETAVLTTTSPTTDTQGN